MNLSEINWDFNTAGTWPLPVKAAIMLFVCAVVVGGGVYFDTLDQLKSLESAEQKEQTLKREFELKQKKAVNFQDYQNQLTQIEASLDEMIRQMPTEEELASLLVDISQTGLASGLEFKLFKPQTPILKDFYSELPINIQVTGKYEELGLFVSGLASLPRIVTIHDVNIIPEDKNGAMLMSAMVKIYNEGAVVSSVGPGAKKKRGRK
ncbi:MAG: type 4a pilus biogenesis protein PilO [Methylococcaceae bacterium]|jgi:type IV pilus assembly protein PilO|nr:type 4a pilus biogenesis protein PilO [Methylococcaceae bacterium]MDD1641882.1 type 4a pilus biogenesis protein PilO [Methylococcaceae bacterium]OYV20733.1 MAG: type IV pilus assembly protein PilO [Methylococcaceae bacterium NSM2-1]